VDASKLLSSATLFYFASHGTPHAALFDELRQACELRLKRQDSKTILFCEESLMRLKLPVPSSHQEWPPTDSPTADKMAPSTSASMPPSASLPLPSIHPARVAPLLVETHAGQDEDQQKPPPNEATVEPSPESYPLVPSTRHEHDFKLFYRFSSDHRYLELLSQLNQSSHCSEYHPWLWFLLPQLVQLPEESPNSLFFGLRSFAESEGFYRDETLGFQLIELLGVVCHRLEERREPIDQVMFTRQNSLKLLSAVTLFSFVSEEVEDESLSYLHRVRAGVGLVGRLSGEDSKKISIESPRGLLSRLRKTLEETLQEKDHRVIAFCEASLRVLKKGQKQGEEGSEKEEEKGSALREEGGEVEAVEDMSETTEVEAEEAEEGDQQDAHSIDSQSHEYNEYTYQLEGMELQTPPSPSLGDDAETSG
jgi:uncharacterized protein (DUF1810 family)